VQESSYCTVTIAGASATAAVVGLILLGFGVFGVAGVAAAIAVTVITLCHEVDLYALPLLSTIVQGVSQSFEVIVNVSPAARGAAAAVITFVAAA
jgi:hypothetical protein